MAPPSPDLTRTALLLVDIQQGFSHPSHWGHTRSNPRFEENITKLLTAFRATSATIIHVAHHSLLPESLLHPTALNGTAVQFYAFAAPSADNSEPVIVKNVNSAFIGTDLETLLRRKSIDALFIVGLTTDHCISTTTRMAANLGVVNSAGNKGRVVLIGDATATFERGGWDAETIHSVHLASLDGEFAEVLSTEAVVELVGGSVM